MPPLRLRLRLAPALVPLHRTFIQRTARGLAPPLSSFSASFSSASSSSSSPPTSLVLVASPPSPRPPLAIQRGSQYRGLAVGRGRRTTNRGFDFQKQLGGKERKKRPSNDDIKAKEVRLIGINGKQEGVVPLAAALALRKEASAQVGEIVDLVQVSDDSPPICRLMVSDKETKGQGDAQATIKNAEEKMKSLKIFRLNQQIDKHDLLNKISNAGKQLQKGHPVKFQFQGKINGGSQTHKDIIDTIHEELIVPGVGHVLINLKQLYTQPFVLLSPFSLDPAEEGSSKTND